MLQIYSRSLSIAPEVLILDGLTGTGKTMFGPILGTLEGIQPGRFEYMIEYLSIISKTGHINESAAQSLIRSLVDVKTYDNSISREVNFRPRDLSSVLKHPDRLMILKQLMMKDGRVAIDRLTKDKRTPFFITHQILTCLDLLTNTYGDGLSVVEMVRHPFYLFDHWLSYLPFHGTSSHDFTLLINHEDSEIPWFANDFARDFQKASNADRVALSISHLMIPLFDVTPARARESSTLEIPFEHFVLEPLSFIHKIELHTKRTFTASVEKILKIQRVPRLTVLNGPNKSIYRRYAYDPSRSSLSDDESYKELKKRILPLLSEPIRSRFVEISNCYENKYGLWF